MVPVLFIRTHLHLLFIYFYHYKGWGVGGSGKMKNLIIKFFNPSQRIWLRYQKIWRQIGNKKTVMKKLCKRLGSIGIAVNRNCKITPIFLLNLYDYFVSFHCYNYFFWFNWKLIHLHGLLLTWPLRPLLILQLFTIVISSG